MGSRKIENVVARLGSFKPATSGVGGKEKWAEGSAREVSVDDVEAGAVLRSVMGEWMTSAPWPGSKKTEGSSGEAS